MKKKTQTHCEEKTTAQKSVGSRGKAVKQIRIDYWREIHASVILNFLPTNARLAEWPNKGIIERFRRWVVTVLLGGAINWNATWCFLVVMVDICCWSYSNIR
ncbi:unnamed protein product [Ceratitis capitata]|uniref:(Mediterranean fruit fly) hypothetical protein n=1 Tax=Ceratitis capitata TaxID=7213 RepID=A0A811U7I3_CERCA|nr:unnamed protein product [Ceratitis capitata]